MEGLFMKKKRMDEMTFHNIIEQTVMEGVHVLDLSKLYQAGECLGDALTRRLCAMLKENYHLHSLDLSTNRIGHDGFVEIAALLRNNHTITYINLGSNLLSDASLMLLADSLKMNQTLRVLNLEDSGFGGAGLLALGDALAANHSLLDLNLASNNIGDEEMLNLCQSLKNNHSLLSLDLSLNQISDKGASDLLESIKTTSIRALNLTGNDITGKGLDMMMSQSLIDNKNLVSLTLKDNFAGDVGAKAIVHILSANPRLAYVNLDWNCITHRGLEVISDAGLMDTRVSALHNYSFNFEKKPNGHRNGKTINENTTVHTL